MKMLFVLLLFSPFLFSQVKENDSVKTNVNTNIVSVVDLYFHIHFKKNKTSFIKDSNIKLMRLYNGLLEYPKMTIEVHGHCDFKEKDKKQLSLKRSLAVINFLVKKGIDRKRLKAKYFSDLHLTNDCKNDNCSEIEKSQNRRVEFVVTAM